MTNEEIVEELYWSAHNNGVFDSFSQEVTFRLKKNNKITERILVVEEVYYDFIKLGLIKKSSLHQLML